jgi:4'-phosphopantetheinyl transferase
VLARTLDADELTRAGRLPPGPHRRAFVAAHGLARFGLSYFGTIRPRDWILRRSPGGKPIVDPAANARGLQFSISHTDDFVAVAVAAGSAIGVDVEALTRRLDVLAVARAYFTRREFAELRTLDERTARDRFFSLWTAKEAVVKATGLGLRVSPAAFDIVLSQPRVVSRHPALKPDGAWLLRTFRPTPRHVVTLAIRGSEPALEVFAGTR